MMLALNELSQAFWTINWNARSSAEE